MGGFLIGTFFGGLMVKYSREIVKAVMKGSIHASRLVAEAREEVKEDLEDLTAEVKREMPKKTQY